MPLCQGLGALPAVPAQYSNSTQHLPTDQGSHTLSSVPHNQRIVVPPQPHASPLLLSPSWRTQPGPRLMFQRVPLSGALASSSALRVVALPPAAPPLLSVPVPVWGAPRPSVPLSGAVASSSGAPRPGLLRVVEPPPVPGG